MKTQREIDKRDSLRVVTSNSFITAKGLEKLSLKARKLLYVVTAQCKMNDEQFYEYSIKYVINSKKIARHKPDN